MPRIASSEKVRTEEFNSMHTQSIARNETNDCTVKALAIVCGIDYDKAHAVLAAKGRKNKRGFSASLMLDAIRELGHDIDRVPAQTFINSYPAPHCNVLKSVTTHHPARFAQQWPKGKFLIFSRRHVSAVVDGVVHDWAKGRALRATSIHVIDLCTPMKVEDEDAWMIQAEADYNQ